MKIKNKIKVKDILKVNLTKIPIIQQIKIMSYFQNLEKTIRKKGKNLLRKIQIL